jgi:hypothetical protein
MAKNKALQEAARAQQDEFYTDIRDIEHELMYYSKELFYDKFQLIETQEVNRNMLRRKSNRTATALTL